MVADTEKARKQRKNEFSDSGEWMEIRMRTLDEIWESLQITLLNWKKDYIVVLTYKVEFHHHF